MALCGKELLGHRTAWQCGQRIRTVLNFIAMASIGGPEQWRSEPGLGGGKDRPPGRSKGDAVQGKYCRGIGELSCGKAENGYGKVRRRHAKAKRGGTERGH